MKLRTCVSPEGRFIFGVHRPHFTAENFRQRHQMKNLGRMTNGSPHDNTANFPVGPVVEPAANWIFEVPNAFPFRGATYIGKAWADGCARRTETIMLPNAPEISFSAGYADQAAARRAMHTLPRPLQLALATTSTDPRDLCCLSHLACTFSMDENSGAPLGLVYQKRPDGRIEALIADDALFDAVANNLWLPAAYKDAMVLRPGVQGDSEIVGDWSHALPYSHVYEYLRRNSYIPWGHYAANMADDAIRYRIQDLSLQDMTGMRHLYYQRSYTRLAQLLDLPPAAGGRTLAETELELLRQKIELELHRNQNIAFNRILWGWNYGFDYAPSGYRLHGSHQQIHQQYALIPAGVSLADGRGFLPAYACGDLVGDFVKAFRRETGSSFFDCYERAIRENRRMDENPKGPQSLVVFEDHQLMLFVPKAQTSQWELQLMPKTSVGNIVEAGTPLRRSLDRAIWTAVQVLAAIGARLITCIEYSKAVDDRDRDQRLLMSFLPKLPESPGAFSEAQLRWITGHYPEDFALICRRHLPEKRGWTG